MKVVVLTTSYPRRPDEVAGVFVRDAVEHLRGAGLEVEVVSPASFRHYGLAYGHGIVGNIRCRPWLVFVCRLSSSRSPALPAVPRETPSSYMHIGFRPRFRRS